MHKKKIDYKITLFFLNTEVLLNMSWLNGLFHGTCLNTYKKNINFLV